MHDNNSTERRIAELEAENSRLRQSLETVKAERRELQERIYGPYPDQAPTPEEERELAEFMKNRVPGEGMKFFAELGLLPGQKP